jgi:hypothetical protein
MAKNNEEHIDQLFREGFDRVEVRYNAHHWERLSAALAAAPSSMDASSGGKNDAPASKKFPRWWLSIVLTGILVMLLIGLLTWSPAVFKLDNNEKEQARKTSLPADTLVQPDSSSSPLLSPNNHLPAESKLPTDTLPLPQPPSLPLSPDSASTDSTQAADDLFIFW